LLISVVCSQPFTQAVYTAVLSREDFVKVAKRDVGAPGALSPSVATSAGLALEILRILRDIFPQNIDADLFDYWTRVFAWFTAKIVDVSADVRNILHHLDIRVNKSKKSIQAKLKDEPFFDVKSSDKSASVNIKRTPSDDNDTCLCFRVFFQ